jgi:hypothetical protein
MKRLGAVVLAAVAAGALCTAAAAKEVEAAKVCGSSGCAELSGKDAHEPFFVSGNGAAAAQTYDAHAGNYYEVVLTMGDQGRIAGTYTLYWLPGSRLFRGSEASLSDPWTRTTAAQDAAWRAAVRGLEPFHPRLARVLVGGKPVADPQSYSLLFAHYPPAFEAAPSGARWIPVTVAPAHGSPWLDRTVHLRYQPDRRLLEAAGLWTVILPKDVGDRLVRRASLEPARTSGGGGHTALFAGIGAAGLAGVALMALVRRRRRDH